MNLRPLLGNFTDPQYRLSRRAQWDVTWRAHNQYLPTGRLMLMTTAQVVLFIAAFALGMPILERLVGWTAMKLGYTPGRQLGWFVAFGVFLLFVWIVSAWSYRFIYIRPIRRAMLDEGYDLCLACGYDLRNLPEDTTRCPECGVACRPFREAQPP